MNRKYIMHTETEKRPYWCHTCQVEFKSYVMPGESEVKCPKCKNEFCELISSNSTAKYFQPYQKKPVKKENRMLKINLRASPVRLLELQQMLQEEEHQRQGVELSQEQLQKYRKVLQKDSECSVCRQDLRAGSQHLIFRCKHSFHEQCLVEWLRIKNSCPTCRMKMISD